METNGFRAVELRVEDGIAWLTLNRPDVRNAMNAEMREEILQVLDAAAVDAAIRCLVVTGAGKGFCTGADLSGGRSRTAEPPHPGATRMAMRQSTQRLVRALLELEKPVIAAVNGVAAGFGVHLALACDLIVASEDARFIEIFVRRGLAVDGGGAYLLPRRIGLARAKELVFLGDDLSATDAQRIGLINRCVPAGELEATVRGIAERIACGPTFALGLSKRLLNRSLDSDLESALAEEAFAQSLVVQSEDAKEGMKAFAEKRSPAFKGR
ncbi:MAG: 2-(1,2-epoxy,2-dihydrophenyl)acetyl-CoA isomerase [Candidatus Binatota bacterium]|nr:2-(1,2-epoxy,2-dihydrophenyl)acetyl-CoA isomerase [Candidatus Binatota bacterium]